MQKELFEADKGWVEAVKLPEIGEADKVTMEFGPSTTFTIMDYFRKCKRIGHGNVKMEIMYVHDPKMLVLEYIGGPVPKPSPIKAAVDGLSFGYVVDSVGGDGLIQQQVTGIPAGAQHFSQFNSNTGNKYGSPLSATFDIDQDANGRETLKLTMHFPRPKADA